MKRALVLAAILTSGVLACRKPSPTVDEHDPNAAPADAGPVSSFVPNQVDLPRFAFDAGAVAPAAKEPSAFNGFASDAGPGFQLELDESHFSLGLGSRDSWADLVRIEDDGSFFAMVKKGCTSGKIGKAGIAKIEAALEANDWLDPPNTFSGPTDSGSTDLRVRAGGREKQLRFRGPLVRPPSNDRVIGTILILDDGGTEVDSHQYDVKDVQDEPARRKQIAAIIRTIKAVTALSTHPVVKCPEDVYSRFDQN